MLKKIIIVLIITTLLALSGYTLYRVLGGQNSADDVQTEAARRGDLKVTVDADGTVRSNQVAQLTWHTSGRVERVGVRVGEQVNPGQELVRLDQTSLPQAMILAQANLVEAQRDLDHLLNSRTENARAAQAVEQAQRALEDSHNPQSTQAEAQTKVAEAQKAVEKAQSAFKIISKPAPQSAIDQADANLLIAKRVLDNTLRDIERINKKLKREEEDYFFFESKELYKQILEALESKRLRDQRQYDDALNKYNQLLEPPDPIDLAIAEGNVVLKQAELQQALDDLERAKNGLTPGELAVLEAQLADAERERQRLANGPDAADITAAEARQAAAQAAINQAHITAPFGGTVSAIYSKAGDQVLSGSQAIRIDDASRLLIDTRVSETDINKIHIGQPVILTFDSIPDREYRGQVIEVPAVGQEIQDLLSFNVVVEIEDADELIRPGMTAKASYVIDDLQDVLLVPNRALRLSQGERVVYVLRDGEIVSIPVSLGIASDLYTQVLEEDIQAGDLIVLNPPSPDSTSSTASQ